MKKKDGINGYYSKITKDAMGREEGNDSDRMRHIYRHENYQKLKSLIMSTHSWGNLPDYIPAGYIEKLLFYHRIIGFTMYKGRLLVAPVTGVGKVDVYGVPYKYQLTCANTKQLVVKSKDVVILKRNISSESLYLLLKKYSDLLTNIDIIFNVNVESQKNSRIITVPKESVDEIKRVHKAVSIGEPTIFALDSYNDKINVSTFDVNQPWTGDKYLTTRQIIINNFLTSIGINNSGLEKKERKITSEVDISNSECDVHFKSSQLPRIKAMEEINKKFNFNITLDEINVEEKKNINSDTDKKKDKKEKGDIGDEKNNDEKDILFAKRN